MTKTKPASFPGAQPILAPAIVDGGTLANVFARANAAAERMPAPMREARMSHIEELGQLVSMCADAKDVFPDPETALETITNAANEIYERASATPLSDGPAVRDVALEALEELEPYLDAIVCYASTQGEHDPNRIVAKARAALAALTPADAGNRCPHCDDTGDVHRADGEWLGECDCGVQIRPAAGGEGK
ncbi:MAG TPA: hypothetical protein VKB96_11120 [Gammaproteobacteria bacterium]|nr:hypothetical protein [Gammaproteobacteria bacterium]